MSTVQRLGEQAADALRELNHRTRDAEAFTEPAELCWLLADLSALAHRMPQLLTQMDRWLTLQHHQQPLRADNDTSASELVAAVTTMLTQAARHARRLAAEIETAQQHAAHLATT